MGNDAANDEGPSLFACSECKTRKVKCDRTKPICNRCTKDHASCHYPTSRKRPLQLPSRPRLHELENRLVELEDKLRQKEAAERHLPGTSLVGTGRFEKLPPQCQMEELTNIYFAKLHPESPMIHPSRYLTSLYQPPHMQPPMCLQYIVMALAARVSTEYKELAEPFYRRARYYIEADEMKEDGHHVTLAHCQCWALIGHFEAQHLWFARASMSTSRAVRLSQILGIHLLDGPGPINQVLPPPRDWSEAEERRRTFWTIFCIDRGTSSTTTWPVLVDVNQVSTRLPGSEEAYRKGIEGVSTTLPEALSYEDLSRSAFACRVVAMHLLHECFHSNHSPPGNITPTPVDEEDNLFWSKVGRLDSSLILALTTLPQALRCPENAHDSDAVLIGLQLHTATICLYRAAQARSQTGAMPVADMEDKASHAAQQIVTTIALAADINTRFRNPFVAFAAFMASFVFLKDYVTTRDGGSMHKLVALLDVMVAVGTQNPGFAATLAVQMARELDKTGVDPTAMQKVRHLVEGMGVEAPVLGREDQETGMVILCPLEASGGGHHPHDFKG